MPDPYESLQVSRRAEIEVITAAYRSLARKYHPDKNASAASTKRMQEINAAYEVLKDPAKRKEYDCEHAFASNRVMWRSEDSIDWSSAFELGRMGRLGQLLRMAQRTSGAHPKAGIPDKEFGLHPVFNFRSFRGLSGLNRSYQKVLASYLPSKKNRQDLQDYQDWEKGHRP